MRKKYLCQILVLVAICSLAYTTGLASDDFKKTVKQLESHYHAKRKSIPFLGLAGFFVKIVKPAGVRNFKLAIFEDQDFSPGPGDFEFEKSVNNSLSRKWQPLVRVHSRASGNRAFVYSMPAGKNIKLLSVTFNRKQAVVVQAEINPEALARFIDKPEILGISLSGGAQDNSRDNSSIAQGRGNDSNAAAQDHGLDDDESADDASGAHSSSDVEGETQQSDRANRPKPKLRTRADDEYDPLLDPANRRPAGAKAGDNAAARPDDEVIKLEARLVNLNVKVSDRYGKAIADLKKEDFAVFEDGLRQEVAYFEPVSAPVNLVLLLDLSGSTRDRIRIMKEAAKRFVDSLDKNDQVAVATFTTRFVVASEFTSDRNLLKSRIDSIRNRDGDTAFYDAMWATLDLLDDVQQSRKAIVVLTDGVDSSFSPSEQGSRRSFDELVSRAEEEDASIHPIYFDTENEAGASYTHQAFATARKQLETLAQQTAGTLFKVDRAEDLEGVYQRVAEELRTTYSLAYSPKNTRTDGEWRKINVKVNRDGVIANTRRGYYAR